VNGPLRSRPLPQSINVDCARFRPSPTCGRRFSVNGLLRSRPLQQAINVDSARALFDPDNIKRCSALCDISSLHITSGHELHVPCIRL
jgi:hypothetical protein